MRALKCLLTFLIVCGIASGARAESSIEGVTLRYQVKPGDIYRYQMTMKGNAGGQGGYRSNFFQMTGSSVYRIKILSVEESGEFTAEWTEETASRKITVKGATIPENPISPNLKTTLRISPQGELIGKPEGDDLSRSVYWAHEENNKLLSDFLGIGLMYPKRLLRAGDSWDNDQDMTIYVESGRPSDVIIGKLSSKNTFVKALSSADDAIGQFRSVIQGNTTRKSDVADMTINGSQSLKCSMKDGMPISGQLYFIADVASMTSIDDPTLQMKFLFQVTRLPNTPTKKPAAKKSKS